MCMGMSMVDVGHILDCSFIFFIEESLSTRLVACQGSLILCLWYAFYCEKKSQQKSTRRGNGLFPLTTLRSQSNIVSG